jgi:thiamine-monophosphate kinase
MASERDLIERIRRKLPSTATSLRVGIGDDACVIRARRPAEWVLTTDAFLENVHFRLRVHSPEVVGYKALARATSDLAAMGARPLHFLLTLALPEACTNKWLDDFLNGMSRAARKFGLVLAGGDTTKHPLVAVSITVIGEVTPGCAVLRSGARPGDRLYISGRLGGAEMGLRLALGEFGNQKTWKKLRQKHFYPEPRLALGEWLAKNARATAMIDTSDGFATDLAHICEASGVGARVYSDKLPTVAVPKELQKLGLDPLRLALYGGEDYELLFTVPPRTALRLPRTILGVPVTTIGEITADKRILLSTDEGGRADLLPALGWDPFRKNKQK